MSDAQPLLSVDDLRVSFATEEGIVEAVDGVSFELAAGEVLAVVGESGSGKSVTAMTLMGLTRSPNAKFKGTAHYKGTELIQASEDHLRRVRGAEIAMIFQDPMTSLNPVQRVGSQIVEQIQEHEGIPDQQARERTVELLEKVGIPRARRRDRDDLPGPDDLAEPGAQDRLADRRADPGARRPARPAGA